MSIITFLFSGKLSYNQLYYNEEKHEIFQEANSTKCDEAKEKWVNGKCRETNLQHKSSPQRMHRNIKVSSEKETCSSTMARCYEAFLKVGAPISGTGRT